MTTEDTWGVNYRALQDLFELTEARMDVIKYEVGVQMIEIYNEQIRDLLVIDDSNRRYPFNSLPFLLMFIIIIFLNLDNLHVGYTKQFTSEWS